MPTVEPVNRILPGTPAFSDLLAQIRAGAKDRDLNDEKLFDQITALKQAGFDTLRLPTELGGSNFLVRQSISNIIDLATADPIVAHIFRTHFWFAEQQLRTVSEARSRSWLAKAAEGGSNAVGAWSSTPDCCRYRGLPTHRREVLQHRDTVRRLPDRCCHHRPRLGGHRHRPDRSRRCPAGRRLGRLQPRTGREPRPHAISARKRSLSGGFRAEIAWGRGTSVRGQSPQLSARCSAVHHSRRRL